MKITTSQLRKIIKEEIARALISEVGKETVMMTREDFMSSLSPEQLEFFKKEIEKSGEKQVHKAAPAKPAASYRQSQPKSKAVMLSPEEAKKARGF